jgi:hypothetical protein
VRLGSSSEASDDGLCVVYSHVPRAVSGGRNSGWSKMTFGLLRIVSVLKRIAEALELANEMHREQIDHKLDTVKGPTKKFTISHPSVDQWEESRQNRGR